MPFKEKTIVSERMEFVRFAMQEGANIRSLCRQFCISAPTGYRWLERYRDEGPAGLLDRSSRPLRSPLQVSQEIEVDILKARKAHPAWGGRKIKAHLERLGKPSVPAASTITEILRRKNQLDPEESLKHQPYLSFEHEQPNDLFQMDFKGHFQTDHGRCHPLTVLDDHSRFSCCLEACSNETTETVKHGLTKTFRQYGLPDRITCDNGSPWGSDSEHGHTPLTVWLMRLGVTVSHSRPFHPQTQGKDERFHRTLKAELLNNRRFRDMEDAQRAFDEWRSMYNLDRPHEALGMGVPADRYRPSRREFPEKLPDIEYGPADVVRKVQGKGEISFRGRYFKVGRAFFGQPVGVRPAEAEHLFEVYFCGQRIATIDLLATETET